MIISGRVRTGGSAPSWGKRRCQGLQEGEGLVDRERHPAVRRCDLLAVTQDVPAVAAEGVLDLAALLACRARSLVCWLPVPRFEAEDAQGIRAVLPGWRGRPVRTMSACRRGGTPRSAHAGEEYRPPAGWSSLDRRAYGGCAICGESG
jgi:hypothetical protein